MDLGCFGWLMGRRGRRRSTGQKRHTFWIEEAFVEEEVGQ